MRSRWVQGNSNGPLVPMVRLVPTENDVIPMVLLVNMHLISSSTTSNKDGELRGTACKTVRSSTNLMRAPQLLTRSLTITGNNTGPHFVP